MRILFLQDHLRMGGTEKQTLALAQFGQANGFESGLIVFRPGGKLTPKQKTEYFFQTLQPFNTGIDEWAPGLIGAIRKFQPELMVLMGKVAHLHCDRIRKHFPRCPVIATFRSGKPPVPYYATALQHADGVITNSRVEQRRLINSFPIMADRIRVVKNGCLLPPTAYRRMARKDGTLRLLCVAMFRPQKNQTELLSIVSQLPKDINWSCTFAGSGKMLAKCREQAKNSQFRDRVTFLGETETAPLYQNHDVAVLTSDKEGLPNALIEAQCAGLPVVAYLVNGVRECFKEGVTGFGIPFGDQPGMVDALTLLARGPERLHSMSKAAREFGRREFGFEEQSARFFKTLKQFRPARG